MMGGWTKSEISTWFKIFHRGMGGKYTLEDWKQFMRDVARVKRDWERLQLMLEGYLLPARDEQGNRVLIATETGLASARRNEIERAGSWFEVEIERVAAAPRPKPWKPEGFPLFDSVDEAGAVVH